MIVTGDGLASNFKKLGEREEWRLFTLSYEQPEEKDEYATELSVSQVLSRSFDLARKSYLQLLPIFAGFGVLVALVSSYIREVTPPLVIPSNYASMTQTQELALAGEITKFLSYRIANYFVEWLILYFAAGIGVWKICQLLGQKKKLSFELPSRANFGVLASTFILTIILIEVSSFLFLVGLLICATMFYLSFPSAAVEGKFFGAALGRSRSLVSGKWGKTFLVFVGVQIIVFIGAEVVSIIVSLLTPSTIAAHVALNLVLALEFPFVSASMVVLYLSYRREEEIIAPQKPPSLYDDLKSQPMGSFAGQRFCSACGAQVRSDERFCHNCGAALSAQL